jgi:hypothetical protein
MAKNLLVVAFAVAALDLLFAATLRLAGPLEPDAVRAGLGAVTLLGALASWLVVRSNARGGFAIATAIPATVSAAWCIGMFFAFQGSMHFIRWAGLSARATDMAWMGRLTLVGIACGTAFGIVLALMMRGQRWAFGATALVAALSIPLLGLAGAAVSALAQIALATIALRDAREMRTAALDLHHAKQLDDARTGGPYRAPESAPLDILRQAARTLRFRAWGSSAAMMAATLFALVAAR